MLPVGPFSSHPRDCWGTRQEFLDAPPRVRPQLLPKLLLSHSRSQARPWGWGQLHSGWPGGCEGGSGLRGCSAVRPEPPLFILFSSESRRQWAKLHWECRNWGEKGLSIRAGAGEQATTCVRVRVRNRCSAGHAGGDGKRRRENQLPPRFPKSRASVPARRRFQETERTEEENCGDSSRADRRQEMGVCCLPRARRGLSGLGLAGAWLAARA